MGIFYISIFIFYLNFFPRTVYPEFRILYSFQKLSKNDPIRAFKVLGYPAPYYCRLKASDIGTSLYKIRDNTVRPRHFLDADNENEIEAILSEHEGHSLHEFIDGNEPLRPVIDFDLPIETLNVITPKLSYAQAKNLLCHAFRDV